MTFTFLNQTFAQANDAQKQKAQALINILDTNNMTIVHAFSCFDSQNITIPSAQTTYNEGLNHTKEAISLMNQEKFDAASTEAVLAMNRFEETLRLLDTSSPVEPTDTETTAEHLIVLKANLTRAVEHVKRLENLSARAANAGYNTTRIENKLGEIRQYLENAARKLYARNLDGATNDLSIAKTFLEELMGYLDKLTERVTASNIEKYLNEAQIRVATTKANITLSATLTPKAKEDAITALNNSEVSLANARDSIDANNVDAAIDELKEAKKWEQESNRAVSALTATPNSVAPTAASVTSAERTISK